MKKIFKIIGLFLIMSMTLVYADTDYIIKEVIDDIYIAFINEDNDIFDNIYVYKRKSDNKIIYSLEPNSDLDEKEIYTSYQDNLSEVSGLSNEQINRINLIAYYGYGYIDEKNNINHTDIKWYAVSQYLIWLTNNNDYDIYFTNELCGYKVNTYANEINEINKLVKNHNIRPNFNEFI